MNVGIVRAMSSRCLALSLAVFVFNVQAESGDEVCFPLYRKAGAIPLTQPCPLTASTAPVNLGNYYCTGNFGADSSIPRYCGNPPKDLGGKCDKTPNPISIGTGNKTLHETDYLGAGSNILSFDRYYNSDPRAATGAVLGTTWRFGYEASLTVLSGGTTIAASRPDGRIIYFSQAGSAYKADADIVDRLERIPATGTLQAWRYVDQQASQIEDYDSAGKLISITRSDGRNLELTYSTSATPTSVAPVAGLLIQIEDEFGRSINLTYNTSRQVSNAVLPDGTKLAFAYDPKGNVQTVTYPDASVKKYMYNEPENTANADLPNVLTGIIDENLKRFATYQYDASGNAVKEFRAGPVDEYSLSFTRDANGKPVSTIVSDPLHSQRTYSYANVLGVAKNSGVSQPGGSGCAAAANKQTYDAKGNASSRTDFNGSKTCYAYDSVRNLEAVRVEGLAATASCPTTPAGYAIPANLPADKPQRKITTTWHPDWRAPVRRAEPKMITTWVYNGQSDPSNGNAVAHCAPGTALLPDGKPIAVLCKRVEQATGDLNGSLGLNAVPVGTARIWSYTYDQYGQLLSANAPRTDVIDATTYTYFTDTTLSNGVGHTKGDLKGIANGKSQLTSFTLYDPNGRVRELKDPMVSLPGSYITLVDG